MPKKETIKKFEQLPPGTITTSTQSASAAGTAADADTVDGFHASATATANTLLACDANGDLPADITGDADTVDGYEASELAVLAENEEITGSWTLKTNMAVDAAITIDGVDISDHEARHLPSGGDPLTTAAPGTNLSVSTANAEGSAESFARSDHGHAITSSSDPGAAAALLASSASGYLTLVKLSAGTVETDTLTDKSGGNLTVSPTGDLIWYSRDGSAYAYDLVNQEEFEITGITPNAFLGDWSPTENKITYQVNNVIVTADLEIEYQGTQIQAGYNNLSSQRLDSVTPDARTGALGIGQLNVASQSGAEAAIGLADDAISEVSEMMAQLGVQEIALRTRLEGLESQMINISSAVSKIRDADIAAEATALARNSIISESAAAVNAQSMSLRREMAFKLLNPYI